MSVSTPPPCQGGIRGQIPAYPVESDTIISRLICYSIGKISMGLSLKIHRSVSSQKKINNPTKGLYHQFHVPLKLLIKDRSYRSRSVH